MTPHDIKLNSGEVYKATGNVARVSATYTDFGYCDDKICLQEFGDITGLPAPVADADVTRDADNKRFE